jgi:hypothetical protein
MLGLLVLFRFIDEIPMNAWALEPHECWFTNTKSVQYHDRLSENLSSDSVSFEIVSSNTCVIPAADLPYSNLAGNKP